MIDAVMERLRTNATELKAVKSAEDLDAITDSKSTAAQHGTAFVIPYQEQGLPNEMAAGAFSQKVLVQILVAFVVRRYEPVQGALRVSAHDTFKNSIEGALAGWAVTPYDDLFELVAGRLAPIGNGVSVYVQTWQTSRELER